MPLKIGDPIPNLKTNIYWLSNVKDEIVSGRATLFHFWAVSCPACKYNMPALQALSDYYDRFDLQTVAVHTPRIEDDLDVERVQQMAAELGITEPCAIDNDHAISNAFQMAGLWPSYFLFDAEGKLRCRAAGGFGVKMMERTLLRLFPDAPALEKPECPCGKNGAGGCCQDS